MPEGQGDPGTNRVGLSEGILLAVSSALAYFLAYRLEAGYLDWFRIPSDLIQLSLDHVVFTWSILLLVAFSLLALLGELPARHGHHRVGRYLTR